MSSINIRIDVDPSIGCILAPTSVAFPEICTVSDALDIVIKKLKLAVLKNEVSLLQKYGDGGERHLIHDEGLVKRDAGRLTLCRRNLPTGKAPDDLVDMLELTENTLLEAITMRFHHSIIYTYISQILVAINPFSFLPLYNPDVVHRYSVNEFASLPPHIFGVAERAWAHMVETNGDQCILLSGESGSGKSETTKLTIHHLMALQNRQQSGKRKIIKNSDWGSEVGSGMGVAGWLERRILESSPILEAFGNAVTIRNHNSSRFGKFVELQFVEGGAVEGAIVRNYLLEKSRVVGTCAGERSYHCFYQLFHLESEMKKRAALVGSSPTHFRYLRAGRVAVPEVDDPAGLEEVRRALLIFGVSVAQQNDVFSLLSAVLHLGNLEFEVSGRDGEDTCRLKKSSLSVLTDTSRLLGISESALRTALIVRVSTVSGEVFHSPLRVYQAEEVRDAMAKTVYHRLFDYLVRTINIRVGGTAIQTNATTVIGVLDIFGFEDFPVNSLEQFCINFANESLQQYFIASVFRLEQEEYIRENVEWCNVCFDDNQACLDLIAKRPTGLIPLLDEESHFPKATDATLLVKFDLQHREQSVHYVRPKQSKAQFSVRHYAGEVCYIMSGFLEKNRDTLRSEVVSVLAVSDESLVSRLFGCRGAMLWRRLAIFMQTVAAFRKGCKPLSHKRVRSSQRPQSSYGYATSIFNQNASSPASSDLRTNDEEVEGSTSLHIGERSEKRKSARSSSLTDEVLIPSSSIRATSPRASPMRSMRSGNSGSGSFSGRKCKLSVAGSFQNSLNDLVHKLTRSRPHFVRCIKSNYDCRPFVFDPEFIRRQLHYTGMLDTVRVRRVGFNVRLSFHDFVLRFSTLLSSCRRVSDNDRLRDEIIKLLDSLMLPETDCAKLFKVGQSKVFLKDETVRILRCRVTAILTSSVELVQRWWRGCLIKLRKRERKRLIILLQAHIRGNITRRHVAEIRLREDAAIYLQARRRGVVSRRRYMQLRCSTVALQSLIRGYQQRHRFQSLLASMRDASDKTAFAAKLAAETETPQEPTPSQLFKSRQSFGSTASLGSYVASDISKLSRGSDAGEREPTVQSSFLRRKVRSVTQVVAYDVVTINAPELLAQVYIVLSDITEKKACEIANDQFGYFPSGVTPIIIESLRRYRRLYLSNTSVALTLDGQCANDISSEEFFASFSPVLAGLLKSHDAFLDEVFNMGINLFRHLWHEAYDQAKLQVKDAPPNKVIPLQDNCSADDAMSDDIIEYSPNDTISDSISSRKSGVASLFGFGNLVHGKNRESRGKRVKKKSHDINGHVFVATHFSIPTFCELCMGLLWGVGKQGYVCQSCRLTCHKSKCHKKVQPCSGVDDSSTNLSSSPSRSSRPLSTSVDKVGRKTGGSWNNTLSEQARREGRPGGVPHIVQLAVWTVDQKGLFQEGIYRVSGKAVDVRELKASLQKKVLKSAFTNIHVHGIATLFKQFLREVPEPVVPFDIYPHLLKAVNIGNYDQMIDRMFNILEGLPESNYAVLELILFHLTRIATQHEINKMTCLNLGVVFGPTLLRSPPSMSQLESMSHINSQTKIVEHLLEEQVKKMQAAMECIELLDSAMAIKRSNDSTVDEDVEESPLTFSVPDAKSTDSNNGVDIGAPSREIRFIDLHREKVALTAVFSQMCAFRHSMIYQRLPRAKAMAMVVLEESTQSNDELKSNDPDEAGETETSEDGGPTLVHLTKSRPQVPRGARSNPKRSHLLE